MQTDLLEVVLSANCDALPSTTPLVPLLTSPPLAYIRVGKVAVVAGAKEVAQTVLSVAGTVYDFLFDESFMWEVVHAAVVRLGLPHWLSMLILGSATASVAYYLAVVRRLAKVYFKARSKGARIATQMSSILAQPYSPTPWAFNRHLTTILGSEIRSMPALNIRRYAPKGTQLTWSVPAFLPQFKLRSVALLTPQVTPVLFVFD